LLTIFIFSVFLNGCATNHIQTESVDYKARAETQVDGNVSVSAVVLSPVESEDAFNAPLASKGIQPIWLQIENQEDRDLYLMLLGLDPNYFSPSEVAWKFRHQENGTAEQKIEQYLEKHIPIIIPQGSITTGYVYTNLDPGAKAYAVTLFGENIVKSFEFVQAVPGFEADFMRIDFTQLYLPIEIEDLDREGLRQYLESLPCCVMGGDNTTPGDPLNLVIVGNGRHMLATLIRRGWDLTEIIRTDTAWKTMLSSIVGYQYRTSPISSLYLFDRPQDIALQKARRTVNERNHLRLWKAPVTVEGKQVWVGQISRDIGIRMSSKTFVTHKIDPVVDEARLYISLDLLSDGAMQAIGYVEGVGQSNREAPQFNYTNDPYFTDGYRVVLFLGEKRVPLEELEYLPWRLPFGRERHQNGLD
jgi:hypothetical protein